MGGGECGGGNDGDGGGGDGDDAPGNAGGKFALEIIMKNPIIFTRLYIYSFW